MTGGPPLPGETAEVHLPHQETELIPSMDLSPPRTTDPPYPAIRETRDLVFPWPSYPLLALTRAGAGPIRHLPPGVTVVGVYDPTPGRLLDPIPLPSGIGDSSTATPTHNHGNHPARR
jgi:hypothetical protein